MKTESSKFIECNTRILGLLAVACLAIVLTPIKGQAQNCAAVPPFPTATTTATQDRDKLMCQLGLTFPVLPVRMGTEWPWNDPSAPTNARPRVLTTPEGNWTDPQGHTVVRTAWGNWHTYDSDPIYSPDPSQHYEPGNMVWPFPTKNGGALSGVGDYGPESNPRYPDIELLKMKDGTPVTTREDWWTKRRPEIFQLVQEQLYGKAFNPTICTAASLPGTCSPAVTWTVGPVTTGTVTIGGIVYPWRQKTFTGAVDTSSYPALRNTDWAAHYHRRSWTSSWATDLRSNRPIVPLLRPIVVPRRTSNRDTLWHYGSQYHPRTGFLQPGWQHLSELQDN